MSEEKKEKKHTPKEEIVEIITMEKDIARIKGSGVVDLPKRRVVARIKKKEEEVVTPEDLERQKKIDRFVKELEESTKKRAEEKTLSEKERIMKESAAQADKMAKDREKEEKSLAEEILPTDEEVNIVLAIYPKEAGALAGEGVYLRGKEVTISATPSEGFKFEKWVDHRGETVSQEAEYLIKIDKDLKLTAEFVKAEVPDDLEDKKRQEEEKQRKIEEEQKKKEEEDKRVEEEKKKEEEEKQRQEEEKRKAEEEKKKQEAEDQKRTEEEKKQAEEKQRIEAEKKAQEQKKIEEEERRKKEEQKRVEEEKRKAEEKKQRIEAEKKAEQERQRIEAEKKAEEERRRKEAEKRRIEIEKKRQEEEEEQRKIEEIRRKAHEESKRGVTRRLKSLEAEQRKIEEIKSGIEKRGEDLNKEKAFLQLSLDEVLKREAEIETKEKEIAAIVNVSRKDKDAKKDLWSWQEKRRLVEKERWEWDEKIIKISEEVSRNQSDYKKIAIFEKENLKELEGVRVKLSKIELFEEKKALERRIIELFELAKKLELKRLETIREKEAVVQSMNILNEKTSELSALKSEIEKKEAKETDPLLKKKIEKERWGVEDGLRKLEEEKWTKESQLKEVAEKEVLVEKEIRENKDLEIGLNKRIVEIDTNLKGGTVAVDKKEKIEEKDSDKAIVRKYIQNNSSNPELDMAKAEEDSSFFNHVLKKARSSSDV